MIVRCDKREVRFSQATVEILDAEHMLIGGISIDEVATLIDDDPIRGSLKERPEAFLALPQRILRLLAGGDVLHHADSVLRFTHRISNQGDR